MSTKTVGLQPTVSIAIRDLERLEWVSRIDTWQGATGRSAAVYALAPVSGWSVGVDIGVTRERIMATDLRGTASYEVSRPHTINPLDAQSLARATRRLLREARIHVPASRGPLRSVVVALPRLVHRDPNGDYDATDDIVTMTLRAARASGIEPDTPIRVENNVNCAAIGEQAVGVARGHDHFAVLQIGVRVGLALVTNGKLVTGVNGAAGEPAFLPFSWTDGIDEDRSPTELEEYFGSACLMNRVRHGWPKHLGQPPTTPEDLVSISQSTSTAAPHARALIRQHATQIGNLAVAVAAIFDPGLIVLTGGIGATRVFSPPVQEALDRLPWRTTAKIGALGNQATVVGAAQLAARMGLEAMLKQDNAGTVGAIP